MKKTAVIIVSVDCENIDRETLEGIQGESFESITCHYWRLFQRRIPFLKPN